MLGLCVAFGEEILRTDNPEIVRELDSLLALLRVSSCVLAMKFDPGIPGSRLIHAQQDHLKLFDEAYGNSVCRPKRHFSLHLPEQKEKWGKIIDCFVCERKHRHFRNLSESIKNLSQFSKSALLKLVDIELNAGQPAERLDVTMCAQIKRCQILSNIFPGQDVTCSSALEARGQKFVRKQIVQLSTNLAVKILCAIQVGDLFYLLVQELHISPEFPRKNRIARWRIKDDTVKLLHVQNLHIHTRPTFYRTNDDGSFSVTD